MYSVLTHVPTYIRTRHGIQEMHLWTILLCAGWAIHAYEDFGLFATAGLAGRREERRKEKRKDSCMSKLQVGKETSWSTHTMLRIVVTKWFRSPGATDSRRCRFPPAQFDYLLGR